VGRTASCARLARSLPVAQSAFAPVARTTLLHLLTSART
jgi:hypothetical protein